MKRNALVPDIFDKFHCTGKECRNNCCQGWSISLTKNDYMNAKKLKKSPELQAIFDSTYKRDKKSVEDRLYGHITLDSNGNCSLLAKDGLCQLQIGCGHSALSYICREFPRTYSIVSKDAIECGLSAACEEVARLLIEKTQPILFSNESDFDGSGKSFSACSTTQNPINDYYWDIKTLCLAVLQADEYDIADRLLIVGIAIKSITEMEPEKIPKYVDSLLDSDDLNYLVDSFKDIEVDPVIAIGEFAAAVVPMAIKKGKHDKKSIEFLRTFGVEIDGGKYSYNSTDSMAKKAEYKKFNEKYPRAMENLLIAVMTAESLPFYKGTSDIWKGYVYLVMLYNLYKHTMIAVMQEDVHINTVVDAIAWISRSIVHNPKYGNTLLEAYENSNSYSLAHMAMIIKG